MITMKFGGTSVQDASAVTRVVEIVKTHLEQRPIVIISAIAQATNVLERTGKLSAEGKSAEAKEGLQKLFARHYLMLDELVKNSQRHAEVRQTIAAAFDELTELIKGISILRELTPRTLDALYCYGELLSSRIVAAALQEQGVNAVWLDTKEFMMTDGSFNRAVPLMQSVREKLSSLALPLVQGGKVPVTQGFIGVGPSGDRTTMGRESSDYSASIIGTALDVQEIQIWTDVDGVLTADPRMVASPQKIKSLSFEEAFELSYFGAKVLHPGTMLPAREKGIPIHICNSRRPHHGGTKVSAEEGLREGIVKSVAYKNNMVMLTISPLKRFSQYIFWEHIYSVLTKHNAVAAMTSTSEYNASIVLDAKHPMEAIIADLQEIGNIQVYPQKAVVCIVGTAIRDTASVLDRVFKSIATLPVTMVSFGASRSNLSMIINESDVNAAISSIHREFFEVESDESIFEPLEFSAHPA